MEIEGTSVNKFVSKICFGNIDRNGKNKEAPAIVNIVSLTNKSFDSSSIASAGIISPPERRTISPGTTFSTLISTSFPFLNTLVLILTIESNFSIAIVAFISCQNPKKLLINKIIIIIKSLLHLVKRTIKLLYLIKL